MMQPGKVGPLLDTAPVDRYSPLGAFGKPAYQGYVQLRAALLARLGPSYANYFSRPTFDLEKRVLTWNADVSGSPVLWDSLSDSDKVRLTPKLTQIREGLQAYVSELRGSADSSRAGGGQALASLLEQAMTIPGKHHLHALGDQPVLSFWGFAPQTEQQAQTVAAPFNGSPDRATIAAPVVTTTAAVAAAGQQASTTPGKHRGVFGLLGMWGLLRALLVLLGLFVLLVFLAWLLRCTPPLASWFGQGGFPAIWLPSLRDCPPLPVSDAIKPGLPKQETVPPIVPKLPEKLDPNRMTIPEEALRTKDLSFLKGKWELGPKMHDIAPNGRIGGQQLTTMQFDEKGRGFLESQLVTGVGGKCRGALRAWYEGQTLRIESEACSGRHRELNGYSLECNRLPDGRSSCQGINKGAEFRGRSAQMFDTWLTHPQ